MANIHKLKENLQPLVGGELRIQNAEDTDRIHYGEIESFEIVEPMSLVIRLRWCARCRGGLVPGRKINLIAKELEFVEGNEYILNVSEKDCFPIFTPGDRFFILYNPRDNEQLYFRPRGDEDYEYADINSVKNLKFVKAS